MWALWAIYSGRQLRGTGMFSEVHTQIEGTEAFTIDPEMLCALGKPA